MNEFFSPEQLSFKLFSTSLLFKRKRKSQKQKQKRRHYTRPNYSDSCFGRMLARADCRDPSTRDGKLFRRRFRVPYPVFEEVLGLCNEHQLFGVSSQDHRGIASVPSELKLLGVLRVLGKGCDFDDVAMSTNMSETVARVSFHTFCRNFVKLMYDEKISPPTGEKLVKVMEVFEKMGLNGCIGSIDVTHVKWDKCPVARVNLCCGKEGFPTLAYEVVVDHSRRIQACTRSFWGARNDKTIVKYDKFVMDMKYRNTYNNVTYYLVDEHGVSHPYTQLYLLCDGGYHKWSCLINPYKHTANKRERRWSEWVESGRKDVECTFGILKQRFRFLRNGINLHNQVEIDMAFFTCCIFHNMILGYDGLDTRWETDVHWEQLNPQAHPDDEGYDMDGVEISAVERRFRERVALGNTNQSTRMSDRRMQARAAELTMLNIVTGNRSRPQRAERSLGCSF